MIGPATSKDLVLHEQPGRPLTKAQRAFNRLVAKVDKLRVKLDRETRRLEEALAFYGQHVYPRLQRQAALRKDVIRALAPFVEDKRLKRKTERNTLRTIIADQLDSLIEAEGSLADEDLRALFERVHGVPVERLEQEEMEATRSVLEGVFGELGIEIDLSDMRSGMSEEAMHAKAAQMAARIQEKAEEEKEEQQQQSASRSKRTDTKGQASRQKAKEKRAQQAEEVRNKSLASVYKQLAKVLHPDLEPEAERRQRKVALMQELTTAYRNRDLHTLLRLELEWIEREKGDLERLTDEKLAVYNQILKEQVNELEWELDELPRNPRYQPVVSWEEPFAVQVRTDGPVQIRVLDEVIASLEGTLEKLQGGEAIHEVRNAIKAYRAATRREKIG